MIIVSLHRFAHWPRQFLRVLSWGSSLGMAGAIAAASILTPAAVANSQQVVTEQLSELTTVEDATEQFWDAAIAHSPAGMTVIFYTPTATCDAYAGDLTRVAADHAIPQVVQRLVTDQTPQLIDFELAGYRVQPPTVDGTVTIDFRRNPHAERHFISLSICEQHVLFGSLRQTLLQNPALEINQVRFTERGRPIKF
ncbi:MAG: hypothetical protein AAGH67_16035 [Cyanobacteria bacterium P01_H01_bin.162]